MRRANEQQVVKNNAGEIYAINLGADFVSEHEWGVEKMRVEMGIPSSQAKDGLDYHSAKIPCESKLTSFVKAGNQYIIFGGIPSYYKKGTPEYDNSKKYFADGKNQELFLSTWRGDKNPPTLAAAWDDDSFGLIISKDAEKDVKDFGKALIKAIESGNFSVWFGGGNNPFSNSGLVVAITSMVPQEVKDYMVEAYKEQVRLITASDATGIKKLLAEKGKKFFACSAKWLKDSHLNSRASKHPVMYWLNPYDQQNNESDWFTVEELTDWANDVEGNPVTKKKKVTA